jgi:diguanylate cyclase (GGDEF)-like protein/PAS domain S-box-containing protein
VTQDASSPPLRFVTKVYLASLIAAAASVAFALLAATPRLNWSHGALAATLTAGVTLAFVTPLNAGHRINLTLETVALLPAVLLLPAAHAALAAWAGITLAHLIRPHASWLPPNQRQISWAETLFNGASLALQAAAAGLALNFIGWKTAAPDFDLPMPLAAVLVAGAAIYLVQRVTLAGVISIQEGIPLPTVFYDSTVGKQPAEHVQYLAQLGVGLLAAVVADAHPWALSLILFPTTAVYVALQQHIAMRRRAETNLVAAQQVAHLGSLDWDLRTDDQQWSSALFDLLGFSQRSVLPSTRSYLSIVPRDERPTVEAAFARARQGDDYAIDHRIVLPDGDERFVHSRGEVVLDRDGHPRRVVGTVHDVTERKRLEERLEHQAFHDPLTDLPNRALFTRRLDEALATSRGTSPQIAVLFLDLDRFKLINDTLGHEAGDQLLKVVAKRLRGIVRRPNDVVARLGGDEFTVLLDDVRDGAEAIGVAERIIAAMTAPITLLESREIVVSTSVGIVRPGPDHHTGAEVLRDADNALYRAKEGGRNRYAVFDASMGAETAERLALEADLRHALDRRELRVLYQPKLDLATHRIVAVEAFLRWEHPTRGWIAPARFIPIAEETGLIGPIGAWALATACREAATWAVLTGDPPILSVNLSAKQLHDPALAGELERLLRETGLESTRLRLEIAETAAMKSAEATIQVLRRLRRIGVRAVIDDFGTGSSSLGSLPRFPIDMLQLDSSFVAGLGRHDDASKVAEAVIRLAHALGLTVVAEGVEREDQLAQLRALGCEQAQGNFFAPPLTSLDLAAFLAGTEATNPPAAFPPPATRHSHPAVAGALVAAGQTVHAEPLPQVGHQP